MPRKNIVATLLIAMLSLAPMWCAAAAVAPSWSPAERAWLAGHPVVRYAVDPQWRPVEYVDGHAARGLSVAYLERVADVTGMRIEWVPMPSWEAAVHAFSSGKVDVLPGGFTDIDDLRRVAPLYSQPYYVGSSLIIATSDGRMNGDPSSLSGKRVAVEEHGKYQGWFGRHYASVRLVSVANEMSALQAVADGRADAAVVTDAVALPLLHDRFAGVLYAVGTIPDVPTVMRMAIRPEQPMLASVVNKALAGISARDAAEIDDRWLSRADFTRPSLVGLLRYDAMEIAFALVAILALIYGWFQAYRTREIVRRSAEEKALFLASMSHEIRSPIQAIVGPLELLSGTGRDAGERALFDVAVNAGHMLRRLLDDLLDYSRLEAGGIRLDLQRCEPAALVAAITAGHRDSAIQKGLTLSLRPGPGAVAVMSDPVRIRQVVDNLLSNALKFTRKGSVTVQIMQAEQASRDSGESAIRTVIEVHDTGSGITPEALATLFKPFARAQHGSDAPTLGNGLGLMISRQLATLLGGSLTLESERGVGTVARFAFVSRKAVSTPDATSPAPSTFADPAPPPSPLSTPLPHPAEIARAVGDVRDMGEVGDVGDMGDVGDVRDVLDVLEIAVVDNAPMSILVIDDHRGVQLTLMHQLRQLGFESDAAGDLPSAADALRSGAYGAALVDGHLGDGDTFETVASYRREEAQRGAAHLPIIGISATTDDGYAERCLASGFDGVLRKPIRLEQLNALLALWFPERFLAPGEADASRDVGTTMDIEAAFETATGHDIEAIKRALDEGDMGQVGAYAHRIVGAASFVVDQRAIAAAARAVELAAGAAHRAAHTDASATHALLSPLVAALEQTYARSKAPR